MTTAEKRGVPGTGTGTDGWRRPARIMLPASIRGAISSEQAEFATRVASSTARTLTIVLPAAIAVIGLLLASVGGVLSGREPTEALGTLGVELGAAMWFGGAIVLGGRPHPTVLRIALLAALGFGGLALVLAALVLDWSGVALDLAMEFGVGAVAVVVLDVLVLGLLQSGLDKVASAAPAKQRGRRGNSPHT